MSDLVYHTGALGDFITTIPAIRFRKKQTAGRPMTLLGRPAIGKFAKDIGLIDNWLDIDDPAILPLFYETLTAQARKLLSPFTTAILFTGDDSPIWKNTERSGIETVRQPPFPSSRVHAIDYHLSLFCNPETVGDPEKTPWIVPSAEALAAAKALVPRDRSRPVALHPGSGSRKKNWPLDRFLSVADHVRSLRIPVLWIKGPAEVSYDFPRGDLTAANLPLAVLAALLSQCRALVGNDSGITHLAAAAGCPTVAIFGPSDPAVWGPRGRNVTVIYKKRSCSPCHGTTRDSPVCDNSCLIEISVDEVLDIFYNHAHR